MSSWRHILLDCFICRLVGLRAVVSRERDVLVNCGRDSFSNALAFYYSVECGLSSKAVECRHDSGSSVRSGLCQSVFLVEVENVFLEINVTGN